MRWYDPLNRRMGSGATCFIEEQTMRGHVGGPNPMPVDTFLKVIVPSFNLESLNERSFKKTDVQKSNSPLAYNDFHYKYYENYQVWRLAFQAVNNKIDLQMLYLRYVRGLTLLEVGKLFGITKERVRQRIAKACWKMRNKLKSMGIEPDELLPV